ncbi:tetratricopeptide repeat protein [Neobacillus citreus]|uniref:Tetratricopeptide repeat protein n=1 Tax=Neobacillus citreus TaxID=2833578 RepID=A0A942YAS3_9BACI|nr:tetratricopeptide repeat protein [Neobacillus citreus]MCH6267755.1 tetratricopeptide repeat protein [Neobacillus citreus]
MKKREKVKKIDNVIFFPGMEKRLTDKGLESLHNKKYAEAIRLLEEAKELDQDNDDVLIGLVLAYFEAGNFQKAKVLAKELLHKGIGDYFQLVDLYVTVLIQLHEYQEIVSTIEVLLEEKEIPPERMEHFLTLLQFSRKMAENKSLDLSSEEPNEDTNPDSLNLLSLTSLNEQMLAISRLSDKNIRPYVPEIEDYLKAEIGHPFLKTILLTLLKEQEVDKDLKMVKFSEEITINPTGIPDVRHQPKMTSIKELLENRLESSNPVLFASISEMVERIFFISYPFELEPENPAAWAAGFQYLAQEYMGINSEINELSKDYDVSPVEITLAIQEIEEIEKISYPNL